MNDVQVVNNPMDLWHKYADNLVDQRDELIRDISIDKLMLIKQLMALIVDDETGVENYRKIINKHIDDLNNYITSLDRINESIDDAYDK